MTNWDHVYDLFNQQLHRHMDDLDDDTIMALWDVDSHPNMGWEDYCFYHWVELVDPSYYLDDLLICSDAEIMSSVDEYYEWLKGQYYNRIRNLAADDSTPAEMMLSIPTYF